MQARSIDLRPLASLEFIAALGLLIVNDFALKPLLHNALTGKLSDVAGLFACAVFAAALWPRQRAFAGAVLAGAFAFWKTSYAGPLIVWLNEVTPFAVGRTVDLTDLVALPMVALGIWAAPRLQPLPLPRVAQLAIAMLAPVAFTATSMAPYLVRSTMELDPTAVVDEVALQLFFDDLAERHGLRCDVCDSLVEGRVYVSRSEGPSNLTVNFDSDRRALFFAVQDWSSRKREKDVLALTADIRAGLNELFPGITASEFTTEHEDSLDTAAFAIRVTNDGQLPVGVAEGAKRTFSLIVEDVVLAHGLRADDQSLVYYAGRRVGPGPDERDLVLVPFFQNNATFQVRVTRRTAGFEALQRALTADLETRLNAAFGATNVTYQARPPY